MGALAFPFAGFPPPNTVQVPGEVFDLLPLLSEAELRVLLVLIHHTFGRGQGEVALSLEALADATGMSRRGVLAGVKGLEEKGIMAVAKAPGGANRYSLLMAPEGE